MDALPAGLRVEARRLRAADGLSFSEIATKLLVSPTTARRWTLDIQLSPSQIAKLDSRMAAHRGRGTAVMAQGYRTKRSIWQEEGRLRARRGELLHQAGCLLYWAEGSKSRNTVTMVNSDMNLLRLFRRFLSECFGIGPDEVSFRINVYTGNGLTIEQIEDRWLSVLDLPRSSLRQHTLNGRPAPTSGAKRDKLPYGVGNLNVRRSTWLVQHIYGVIQEYGGFDEPRWLDLPS